LKQSISERGAEEALQEWNNEVKNNQVGRKFTDMDKMTAR
jgi:hypothetical protein